MSLNVDGIFRIVKLEIEEVDLTIVEFWEKSKTYQFINFYALLYRFTGTPKIRPLLLRPLDDKLEPTPHFHTSYRNGVGDGAKVSNGR